MHLLSSICFVASLVVVATSAYSEDAPRLTPVTDWLVLGPVNVPLPAFHSEGDSKVDSGNFLSHKHVDVSKVHPVAGARVPLIGGSNMEWVTATADSNGVTLPSDTTHSAVTYLATV